MLKVKHEATFFGANPFSANPVIVASILSDGDTFGAIEALTQGCVLLHDAFPEWLDATAPAIQEPVAQIAQTAARWALGALNEVEGYLHDAGAAAMLGGARLWLGFHHQNVSLSALRLALEVLQTYAGLSKKLEGNRIDSALASLWQLCRNHHPDYQARILMQGARARDIPVLQFITGSRFWQYGWGCRSRVFFETLSNADGHVGGELQRSKVLSKMLFSELGIPTPNHQLVSQIGELPAAAKVVGWPCVLKPVSLGGGKGVTAGIRTISELEAAFTLARRYTSEPVMVEAFVPGQDYRLTVIDGRFFAAVRREPSSVIGDGKSSIAQLLAEVNRSRSPNKVKSHYLRPIPLDDILEQHLARQGVSVSTILEVGRHITLRSNANLSTGGVCINVTNDVHFHFKQMAETIAQTMGLATAGIDYITTDIGKSWQEGGALIEVNATPGADAVIAAGYDANAVAWAILGAAPARIPVQLIVVPQSDLVRALSYLRNVQSVGGFGWACNGQAAIDGMLLRITRSETRSSVETLLRHKSVKHACVVYSAEEIVRHGMPVDKVDYVTLCNDEKMSLPAEWIKVLEDHSKSIKKFSSWIDLSIEGFALRLGVAATAVPLA